MTSEYKRLIVDRPTIEKRFIFDTGYQRDFKRETSVMKHIRMSIREEGEIDTVITVSKIGAKYRVIDGQHRLMAICIENKPTKITLKVYKGLTFNDEVDKVRILNDLKVWTSHQKIASYKSRLWFIKEMKKKGRVKISHSPMNGNGKLSIGMACMAFARAKHEPEVGGWGLVRVVDRWGKEEFKLFEYAAHAISKLFGPPEKNNWVYRTTAYCCILGIYWKNKDRCPMHLIDNRIRRIFMSPNITSIVTISRLGGFAAVGELRPMIEKTINRSNEDFQLKV